MSSAKKIGASLLRLLCLDENEKPLDRQFK